MSKRRILLRWGLVLSLVLLGIYGCIGIRLNDNVLNLLPGQAVSGDIMTLMRLGLVDRVYITLTVSDDLIEEGADTGLILKTSVGRLGDRLRDSGLFSFVLDRLPPGYEYSLFSRIRKNTPFLLEEEDYQDLDLLITEEGIREALQKSFMLLNSPAGIGLKTQIQQDPLGIVLMVMQKLNRVRSEFTMQLEDGVFFSTDRKSCLIIAQSKESLTDSEEAAKIAAMLEDSYRQTLEPGVEPGVIGSLPHTLANSSMIRRDLRLLLPLASVLLLSILWVTLRDIRALIVFAVPFLAAPPAVGLTSLLYGELSGLALGFGIVLLGIGVDFSIHLFVALTREKGDAKEKLQELRRPVGYATLTTATVFAVLLGSSVLSHRQMALLALAGILLAVAFAWLIIPAIGCGTDGHRKDQPGFQLKGASGLLPAWRRTVVCCWVLTLAAGLYCWPKLHYNGDLRGLDVADEKVISDELHFSRTWGKKGEQAFIIVSGDTLQQVLDRNSEVYRWLRHNTSMEFQSFAPVLPGPLEQRKNYHRWNSYWTENGARFRGDFDRIASGLGFAPDGFQPFFAWLKTRPEAAEPELFPGGPLEAVFKSMLSVQSTDAAGSRYLAMTVAGMNGEGDALLDRLQEEVDGVGIINNRKWKKQVETYMRHDILRLSGAAGLAIFSLVFFQFRRIVTTLAVLSPVLSALAAMSVFSHLSGGGLNMMHLIMGIMVIGLSVDYGIFVVCSGQSARLRSASFAVSVCAASSLAGFGVLACASHPALHALGITVLAGIGAAWPTALMVSPVLNSFGRR